MAKAIYRVLLIMLFSVALFPAKASADVYDNALTYYNKYCKSGSEVARLNPNDGYIYFCSRGTTATSSIKYRTVGYTITISIDGKEDHVEVKLGGAFIKNVSEVNDSGYTYVLRRVKHSKLNSLFNGNKDITWNKIYQKKNTYCFDAIMTVVSSGKPLCGNVTETSGYRKITAENNAYLYKTLKGIKNAQNWSSPDDLDSFFNKKVTFDACTGNIYIGGMDVDMTENLYPYNGFYYIRRNSWVSLPMVTFMKDMTAGDVHFHPNFNMYNVSGWCNNQKFFVAQGDSSTTCAAGKFYEEGTGSGHATYFTYDTSRTSGTDGSMQCFYSCGMMYYTAVDGMVSEVTPEARVYYDSKYPFDISNINNLCDQAKAPEMKKTFVSDGTAPSMGINTYVKGFGYINVPFMALDYGSGIRNIALFNNNDVLLKEIKFDTRVTEYTTNDDFTVKAEKGVSYYFIVADNVGNLAVSEKFSFNVPKAHIINVSQVNGINGYNCSNISAYVYGGNSEIASFTIVSDDEDNPSGERIVLVNKSVMNKTLPSGLYEYSYSVNPKKALIGKPDGEYNFLVISGGKYVSSTPGSVRILKDTTGPLITFLIGGASDCWYKGSASFNFKIKDEMSGMNAFSVKCDGGIVSTNSKQEYAKGPVNGSYKVTESGEHIIDIAASDMAGNMSYYSKTIKVDAIKPLITLPKELYGLNYYSLRWINRKDLKSAINISDSLSGLDYDNAIVKLYETVDNICRLVRYPNAYNINKVNEKEAKFVFSDEYVNQLGSGKYEYSMDVFDYVGNMNTTSLFINLDVDKPDISEETLDGWSKEDLKGNIIVTDEHSGVNSVVITCNGEVISAEYEIGKNSCIKYVDASEYASENMDIHVIATDMVGNKRDYILEADYKPVQATLPPIGSRIRTRLRYD